MLWLWRRPVATAPIQPLAWESPYAAGVAQEMAKRQKKKKEPFNTVSMRVWVLSLALLSGLRTQCCRKLQCRSQMQLGFSVAVTVV